MRTMHVSPTGDCLQFQDCSFDETGLIADCIVPLKKFIPRYSLLSAPEFFLN